MCRKILYIQAGFVGMAVHVLEQFQMRILEPEDGGGSRHKECGLHKNTKYKVRKKQTKT
jgi:hypothetical protein